MTRLHLFLSGYILDKRASKEFQNGTTRPSGALPVLNNSSKMQNTCGRVPRYSQFGGTRYGFEKEQRGRRPSDTAQQTATKSETRSEKLANARPLKPMAKALEFLECDGLQIARRVDDTSTSPTSHHLPSSEHKKLHQ